MLRTSLLALALPLALSIGCSSTTEGPATADAATDAADTAPVDTGKPDTGKAEVAPLPGCETELSSDFACTAPVKIAGSTACSDTALLDFVQKCLAADVSVPPTCAAWKTANAECASCVAKWSWDTIPGAVYPDDWKCWWSNLDATCAKSVNCLHNCQDEVCVECEGDEGNACYAAAEKSGGRCWEVAGKASDTCLKAADLSGCNVDEIYASDPSLETLREEILKYYRGACRDNGNWKNATMPSGDGGVAETGVTETGVSDAADAG